MIIGHFKEFFLCINEPCKAPIISDSFPQPRYRHFATGDRDPRSLCSQPNLPVAVDRDDLLILTGSSISLMILLEPRRCKSNTITCEKCTLSRQGILSIGIYIKKKKK